MFLSPRFACQHLRAATMAPRGVLLACAALLLLPSPVRGAVQSWVAEQGAAWSSARWSNGFLAGDAAPQVVTPGPASVAALDGLGTSLDVSADGRVLVAGAPNRSPDSALFGAGQAFVFVYNGSSPPPPAADAQNPRGYTLGYTLIAGDAAPADGFGNDVAVNGDGSLVVVGANKAGAMDRGAVYIFTRCAGLVWTQTAVLYSPAPADFDTFGASVAVSADGRSIVACSPNHAFSTAKGDAVNATNAGQCYVFRLKSDGSWAFSATLQSDSPSSGDLFGGLDGSAALSSDGSTVLVGAPGAGLAFAFKRQRAQSLGSGGFSYATQDLVLPSPSSFGAGASQFGSMVALSSDGSVAVVGAPTDTCDSSSKCTASAAWQSGSVTAFVWNGTDADPAQRKFDSGSTFFAKTPAANASFGIGLAIAPTGPSDDPSYKWRVVVGASGAGLGPSMTLAGTVSTFLTKGSLLGTWDFEIALKEPFAVASNGNGFGYCVVLSDDGTLLTASAPYEAYVPSSGSNLLGAGALINFFNAAKAPPTRKSSASLSNLVACGAGVDAIMPTVEIQFKINGVDLSSMQAPANSNDAARATAAAAAAAAADAVKKAAITATKGLAFGTLSVDVARLRDSGTGVVLFLNQSYLSNYPDTRARRRVSVADRRLATSTLYADVVLTAASLTAANKLGVYVSDAAQQATLTTGFSTALGSSSVAALVARTGVSVSAVGAFPPVQPPEPAAAPPDSAWTVELISGLVAACVVAAALTIGSLFDARCACFWRACGMRTVEEEVASAGAGAGAATAKVAPEPMADRATRVAVASATSTTSAGSGASPTNAAAAAAAGEAAKA